jgi:2-polyprenyl-3-methyl-5-hydroxy-6-metoxy-1,4-benzoquinol methylase
MIGESDDLPLDYAHEMYDIQGATLDVGRMRDFRNRFRPLLQVLPDGELLEIGPGRGELAHHLSSQGRLVMLESSEMLGERLKKEVGGDCELRIGSWSSLGESDHHRFAAVFALHVLEHVPWEEVLGLLVETRKCIKPGGALVLEVPNMAHPFSGHSRYADFTHRTGFTSESLFHVLKAAGFRVDKVEPVFADRSRTLRLAQAGGRFAIRSCLAIVLLPFGRSVPRNISHAIWAVGWVDR